MDAGNPVLYIVACGGHVAGQLDELVRILHEQRWDVCVIATPAGLGFMDTAQLEAVTGYPVRSAHRRPDEPSPLPGAHAIVVVPATFNTINKWAHGISDTYALGILNEAIGLGLPMLVAPTANAALAAHPAFVASVDTLRSWGVRVLFDPSEHPPPTPGTGMAATDFFPWDALCEEISTNLRAAVGHQART